MPNFLSAMFGERPPAPGAMFAPPAPSFGDRFQASAPWLMAAMAPDAESQQTAMAGAFNHSQGLRKERREEVDKLKGQQATSQWLQSEFGLDEQKANTAATNKSAMDFYIGQAETKAKAATEAASQPSFGLNPIWGQDAQGNPVLGQLGKDGSFHQVKTPEGFNLSTGVDKVDLGTQWGLLDKRSGQMVGTMPKDIEGAAAAEVRGKGMGEAQVNLGGSVAKAEQMLQTIQDIKSDPSRERATGVLSPLNRIPATGGYDFQQKVEQLKGKAFLEAFESLKGGGQITEVEGQKATQAIARLSTAQSDAAFMAALSDLESVVKVGIARSQQSAGQPSGAGPGAAAPADPLGIR